MSQISMISLFMRQRKYTIITRFTGKMSESRDLIKQREISVQNRKNGVHGTLDVTVLHFTET